MFKVWLQKIRMIQQQGFILIEGLLQCKKYFLGTVMPITLKD